MTDPDRHVDHALARALASRDWLDRPRLERNDPQTFELGFRAGWHARATGPGEVHVTAEFLRLLVNGDTRARITARAIIEREGER